MHPTLTPLQQKRAEEIAEHALAFVESRDAALSSAMIRYLWFDGDPNAVADALKAYQNEDGGFGNRLEPDIHSPASNPFAARLAMQTMVCIPPDASEDLREELGPWLQENQSEDGDWHFSEETRSGEMQPWFAAWEFPNLNPACCVLGWATPLGLATEQMSKRVADLFESKASIEQARLGSFYELLPYVEYSLATQLSDDYLDAIAANIVEVGKGFEDAGHFFNMALDGSEVIARRVPEDLWNHWIEVLLNEPLEDGGWPTPYDDAWRDWTTASSLVTLARLR